MKDENGNKISRAEALERQATYRAAHFFCEYCYWLSRGKKFELATELHHCWSARGERYEHESNYFTACHACHWKTTNGIHGEQELYQAFAKYMKIHEWGVEHPKLKGARNDE